MENPADTTAKRAGARTYLMDAKSVAYLLAPCILFTLMACLAVFYGRDYAAMPKEKVVLERYRKDAELRKIVAANIANGDPIPDRQGKLRVRKTKRLDTCTTGDTVRIAAVRETTDGLLRLLDAKGLRSGRVRTGLELHACDGSILHCYHRHSLIDEFHYRYGLYFHVGS